MGREKRGGTPTRHSKHEEQVEVLQAELEKKTHMLLEVKKHLREAAEREQRLQEATQDPKVSCLTLLSFYILFIFEIFIVVREIYCSSQGEGQF